MNQQLTGLPAWLVQRLSAVYMALYLVVAALWWWAAPDPDYVTWSALFRWPPVSIATAMFLLALLLHAWVGLRDVILDYAGRFPAMRLFLLSLLGGWLIALGFWCLRIVIGGMMP